MKKTTHKPSKVQYSFEQYSAIKVKLLHAICFMFPFAAFANTQDQSCIQITENLARLECYDKQFGKPIPVEVSPNVINPVVAAKNPLAPIYPILDFGQRDTPPSDQHLTSERSPLSLVWELDQEEKRGTFRLVPHKTNYLLPVHYSNSINNLPSSPATGRDVASKFPLNDIEAKFQLSFKLKAWENLLGDNGDLWFAYTQQSNWQLYNNGESSPFRATDYEPEVIFATRTNANILGWRWRLLNLGFVHQSNGRPLPLSRSWNRVYAQVGLERGPFTLLIRPWFRLSEGDPKDDNPDIRDYFGSADIRLGYVNEGHVFSLLGRYSGKGKKGGIQAEWAFPLSKSLKGYVQFTNGYGANLLDYNHSQSTIGFGFLLLPWR
jgi:phospholipase A1